MAASNFEGLKARWMDALGTDETDDEFLARLPDLIGDAELRIYRDLDPLAARRVAQPIALTAGVATVALPEEAWVLRRLQLLTGTARSPLLPRQQSYLDEYWPDPALTGTPRYYCLPEHGVLILAPTPEAGSSLLADYTYRPETMSEANPDTWLATHYPDLLFIAGMIWLAGWTKAYGTGDDPRMQAHWDGQYAAALIEARREEALKKGQPTMEVGPSPPIPAPGG